MRTTTTHWRRSPCAAVAHTIIFLAVLTAALSVGVYAFLQPDTIGHHYTEE